MGTKVSFKITSKQNLIQAEQKEGQISFVSDTGEIYVDYKQQRKLFAEVNPQWDDSDLENESQGQSENQGGNEEPSETEQQDIDPAKTRVTFFWGEEEEYSISGELTDSSLHDISDIKSIVIGNTVTSIQNNLFRDANRLQTVVIPSSITQIGDVAFAGCSKLTQLTFEHEYSGANWIQLGNRPFTGTPLTASPLSGLETDGTTITFSNMTMENVRTIPLTSGNWCFSTGCEIICSDGSFTLQ